MSGHCQKQGKMSSRWQQGPEKGLRPSTAEAQGVHPIGSKEEWPHFTAENTEALRFLTHSKSGEKSQTPPPDEDRDRAPARGHLLIPSPNSPV